MIATGCGQKDSDVIGHPAADVSQIMRHQVIERLVEIFSAENLRRDFSQRKEPASPITTLEQPVCEQQQPIEGLEFELDRKSVV